MSLAAAPSTNPERADLPPRTWRGWWLSWPKWFRIGCWAALGLVMLHVALLVWVAIRLREDPEIAEMRRRGANIVYFWELQPKFFKYQYDILAGLYGRTWGSIAEIHFDHKAVDEDVLRIGRYARSLKELSLSDAPVSPEAIGELGRCHHLVELNLNHTDTDDAAINKFSQLQQLKTLHLMGTLVTDDSVPVLKGLPHLAWIDVSYTDVSLNAVKSWRKERSDLPAVITTERSFFPEPVVGVIRWSDGRRSGSFDHGYEVCLEGPSDSEKKVIHRQTGWSLRRSRLWCQRAQFRRGDGEYRFTLSLNHEDAEPVTITVTDGRPSTNSIEFQMPCTKAQALGLAGN